MTEPPINAIRPPQARWTHIALRVSDLDASISWYDEFTPLQLLDRHQDEFGFGAWLGQPDSPDKPFILVLAEFLPATDPFAAYPKEVLAPFAHFGIELPERADIEAMAARGEAAGCLAMAPRQMPDPIGYICMLRDPDGNMVEFSYDQGVYAKAQEVWGITAGMTGAAATALAYLASFAGGDPDAIAAHVAQDFHNEHTSALGSSSTGRAEYRRRLPAFLVAFPGLRYEVEQVVADGPAVAVAYRMTATSEGHPVVVRGVMMFEIADGVVQRRTDYWDSLGFLRQVTADGERDIGR